ncbi:CBS domain-containing protein [Saccharomonospora sp. NPDC046836]|uniref:CBS domain-containing protein n=1 Tax=Saccharomonospora sp. NPDC046836 TaxID=3156921 RepID=UPI0033D78F83
MLAGQIMTERVVTVSPDTPVKRATKLLAEHGFSALPVLDDDERLVGIVTEADCVRDRVPPDVRTGAKPGHPTPPRTVGEVMTSPVTAMSTTADLAELVSALLDNNFRAMPIVDGQKLAGIVTRGDVVRALSRDDATIARDIRRKLLIYGGADRWTVHVRDGVATIVDEYDDETDRHVATVLAESVPGVTHAETLWRTVDS